MARLQILQLPEGDSDERPPFVLVIDEVQDPAALNAGFRTGFQEFRELVGARSVLAFAETVDIPANDFQMHPYVAPDVPAEETQDQPPPGHLSPAGAAVRTYIGTLPTEDRARTAAIWKGVDVALDAHNEALRDALGLDNDKGIRVVAAARTIRRERDEASRRAAEYDTALTRVRGLSETPEVMDAQHADPSGYLHGYGVAIREAKRAARSQPNRATG